MNPVEHHTDLFNRETMARLLTYQPAIVASLYMPAERKGPQTQQQPIRLKNLLRQAEEQLSTLPLQKKEIDQTLAPAQDLLANSAFWQFQSDGLVLFLTPDEPHSYRLPLPFTEQVVVSENFYLKPLLPLISHESTFYLLTLNQQHVQLYQGSRFSLTAVELPPETPTSLADELQFDQFEKQLQSHTGTGRTTASGREAAMFFGHGDAGDEAILKEQLDRFFRHLDNGVRKTIQEGTRQPLLLAGVEYLQGIYRQANQYHDLMPVPIEKDPETLTLKELHTLAWELLAPTLQTVVQEHWDLWQHLHGAQDPRAGQTLETIVSAAVYQRVDTLFLAEGKQQWGSFSATNGALTRDEEYAPGREDLFDLAATHTLLNGGNVYVVPAEEMPAGLATAAILRY